MTSTRIAALQQAIAPVRARLTAHPLYNAVQDPAALRTFMEYHVYAVWDFMSLLKSLQQSLTCTQVPWIPRGSANTRYLINEIVTGEESDVDEEGRRTSHFELYLRAMRHAGAATDAIDHFIGGLEGHAGIDAALTTVSPENVRPFLQFTFETIATGEPYRIASVFTFGREDLIPDLFLPLVRKLEQETSGPLAIFRYYLERHIEVDGGHHSHLAMAMVEELCGDDDKKWAVAARDAQAALEARIALWDAVLDALGHPHRLDPREKAALA